MQENVLSCIDVEDQIEQFLENKPDIRVQRDYCGHTRIVSCHLMSNGIVLITMEYISLWNYSDDGTKSQLNSMISSSKQSNSRPYFVITLPWKVFR